MGRPGSALDNAVIEAWHSTLEFELRRLQHFATRAQARARVAAWIEDYNTTRRHSALGMLSPGGLRASAGGRGGGLICPRFSAAQDRPVLGPVKVVPPRGRLTAPLRGLHLDSACAPAITNGGLKLATAPGQRGPRGAIDDSTPDVQPQGPRRSAHQTAERHAERRTRAGITMSGRAGTVAV
jgi:hypothetical protein